MLLLTVTPVSVSASVHPITTELIPYTTCSWTAFASMDYQADAEEITGRKTSKSQGQWCASEAQDGVLTSLARKYPPACYRGCDDNLCSVESSIHNTRIERLWVDTTIGPAQKWKNLFLDLHINYGLDPNEDDHLGLLHYLYLDAINRDLTAWAEAWNSHELRVYRVGGDSPRSMWYFGMIEKGLGVWMTRRMSWISMISTIMGWTGRHWWMVN